MTSTLLLVELSRVGAMKLLAAAGLLPPPAEAASGSISAQARTKSVAAPRPPLPQSTLERSPPRPPVPQSALPRSVRAPRSLGFDIPLLFALVGVPQIPRNSSQRKCRSDGPNASDYLLNRVA